MKSRLYKQLISCLIVISILMSFVACNNIGNGITFQNDISGQEIFRLLIEAIDNPEDLPECYSSIPNAQKVAVSYSYFYEYVSIMRSLSSVNGTVESFRLLSSEEIDDYLQGDNSYGDLIGAELLYSTDSDIPVYLFLNADSNNRAYLSSEWVAGIISIYSYAEHYFSMLEEHNVDGLFTLLRPGLDEVEYIDTTVYSRADAISEFYQHKVTNINSQYYIDVLVPDYMVVTLPEVFNDDGMFFEEHSIEVHRVIDDSFYIVDDIPYVPDENMVNLCYFDDAILTCGANYNSGYITSIFGSPINVSIRDLDEEDMSETNDYNKKVIFNYPGLLLAFHANYSDASGYWSGELVTIKINSESDYTIGSGMYIGMSRFELMELYPFIETSEMNISFEYLGITYNVEITFDEKDTISKIRVNKI